MENKILTDIKNFFTHECGLEPAQMEDEQALFSSGVIDSFDVFRLISFLENHFKIKLNAFELSLEKLDTIGRITNLVKEKISV